MKFRTAAALFVVASVALTGAAPAGAAKKTKRVSSQKVLKRAFAASAGDTAILHLRTRTNSPGTGTFTDDVWMHIGGAGFVDKVRELRVDGAYAGLESVFTQPNGLSDPRGAIGSKREEAGGQIRTMEGISYSDVTIGGVVDTALDAARGELDLSKARAVTYEGRAAYEVRLRDATGTPGSRNPSQVSVTLWIDRSTGGPIAVRWGEGADHWRSADIQAFELLPDDAAHQPLLNFG